MRYISLLKARKGISKGMLVRRASWSYPEGLRPIAEHWVSADSLVVIAVYEADDFTLVDEVNLQWSDIFEIITAPAIPIEKALRAADWLMMEDSGFPRYN